MHPVSVFHLARLRAKKLQGKERREFLRKVLQMGEKIKEANTGLEIEKIVDQLLSLIRMYGPVTEEEFRQSSVYFEDVKKRFAPDPSEALKIEVEKDLIANEIQALKEEAREDKEEEGDED